MENIIVYTHGYHIVCQSIKDGPPLKMAVFFSSNEGNTRSNRCTGHVTCSVQNLTINNLISGNAPVYIYSSLLDTGPTAGHYRLNHETTLIDSRMQRVVMFNDYLYLIV